MKNSKRVSCITTGGTRVCGESAGGNELSRRTNGAGGRNDVALDLLYRSKIPKQRVRSVHADDKERIPRVCFRRDIPEQTLPYGCTLIYVFTRVCCFPERLLAFLYYWKNEIGRHVLSAVRFLRFTQKNRLAGIANRRARTFMFKTFD